MLRIVFGLTQRCCYATTVHPPLPGPFKAHLSNAAQKGLNLSDDLNDSQFLHREDVELRNER